MTTDIIRTVVECVSSLLEIKIGFTITEEERKALEMALNDKRAL